jgi:Flp pilus assembly protein TadG
MIFRSHLRKLVRGTSGQEIIEAAIVIPLLFMILFGIYWFGRAFNIYGTINHAAREGARAGIQTCASCTQLSPAALRTQVAAAVTQALQASHLDPTKAQNLNLVPAGVACRSGGACTAIDLGGGPGTGKVRFCPSVQLNAGSSDPPVCGVVVSFQYPYQFWFPFTSLNKQTILLEADVQADGEE